MLAVTEGTGASAVPASMPSLKPLGDPRHTLSIDIGEQAQELLAPDARRKLPVAHLPRQDARNLLENPIASGMAMPVVYRLEVIEIEDQQRERRTLACVPPRSTGRVRPWHGGDWQVRSADRCLPDGADVRPRPRHPPARARSFSTAE